MRELRLPLIVSVLMILVLAVYSLFLSGWGKDGLLKVTFLDVGQGDATFIESPTGMQVLIDGGKGKVVLPALSHEMSFFDRDIDMVVATHPDQDHIGGLVAVLDRYRVHTILMTENKSETPAYEALKDAIQHEGAEVIFARQGQVYDLGTGQAGSSTLTILFPDLDTSALESNTASIVSRLTYGSSEYVFTGDSPQSIEEYLVGLFGTQLQSDVLKLGHHGSRTSSSESFLSTIAPTYALISAGKNNSYGHPHKEVIDLLKSQHIPYKNTADEGSIHSVSDGQSVWFR